MTNFNETLSGCPDCDISSVQAYENDYGRWQVGCGRCGSHSGSCKTREEAVALWNRRSAYQAEPPADVASLLRDMRCQVKWSDVATMPIPLYERMKAAIAAMRTSEQNPRRPGKLVLTGDDIMKLHARWIEAGMPGSMALDG